MTKQGAIHSFQRPVNVLLYLSQKKQWDKSQYRALSTHQPQWEKNWTLTNGFVQEGKLILRRELIESQSQPTIDTLLLQDQQDVSWFDLAGRPHKLPPFLQLKMKEGEIWLELLDDYYPMFGSKARDRFDIMPLLPGHSIAIHMNARFWHTMAGFGMDTHYVENYLYLENLGQFEAAELVDQLSNAVILAPQKEIDLRQMMY